MTNIASEMRDYCGRPTGSVGSGPGASTTACDDQFTACEMAREDAINDLARLDDPEEAFEGKGSVQHMGHTIAWYEVAVRADADDDLVASTDHPADAFEHLLRMARRWGELEAEDEAWPEERMDSIGQNGPDGLAYSPEDVAFQGNCQGILDSSGESGRKFDGDKLRMDLLFKDMPLALREVVNVLTQGANKYAPGNWQHVPDADTRYLAAGLRHELALANGQEMDPETDCHHLAHLVCCAMFRLELALREGV